MDPFHTKSTGDTRLALPPSLVDAKWRLNRGKLLSSRVVETQDGIIDPEKERTIVWEGHDQGGQARSLIAGENSAIGFASHDPGGFCEYCAVGGESGETHGLSFRLQDSDFLQFRQLPYPRMSAGSNDETSIRGYVEV